jgi:sensor domain CHASE-containing protein
VNLREKTLLVLSITFISGFILLVAISLTFVVENFSQLEQNQAKSDVVGVTAAT